MKITPNPRRFHLERVEDVTGISGTGRVAEGFVASDGKVALRWLSACGSWVLYDNADALLQVHGHHGATKIVWDDQDERGQVADLLRSIMASSSAEAVVIRTKGDEKVHLDFDPRTGRCTGARLEIK